MSTSSRQRVRIQGVTQGVGFRPLVAKLAQRFELSGWVRNDALGLEFEIQGDRQAIDRLLTELQSVPPPLAQIDSISVMDVPTLEPSSEFFISASQRQPGISTPVAADTCTCSECLRELMDGRDRRFGYPFINCTHCGPRFTIVESVPYDRAATTMRAFPMCDRCQAEYDEPQDRRFHAQPNACQECGPSIWFVDGQQSADAFHGPKQETPQGRQAMHALAHALQLGLIAGLKGIGGFHLICDATNAEAISELRRRKGRIDKPLAVMVRDIAEARELATVSDSEASLLVSKERPIVLLKKCPMSVQQQLLEAVAPEIDFVGLMLPYSPLHYLLIEAMSPLVVTSGNVSEESIARTNLEARSRLLHLADCFLLHNREIHVTCDDSVVRTVEDRILPIRRSRGYVPLPIRLSECGPSVLAVGAELKSTFCLTKGEYAYMSQHLGDLGNVETLHALQRNSDHFQGLFQADVSAVAGDMHPDYLSARWARQLAEGLGVPFIPIQHHHAHAASLIAENQRRPDLPIIACCFDGTGLGADGASWGGEFILNGPNSYQRFAHLSYFPLPGGDAAVQRPYRAALAALWNCNIPWHGRLPCLAACRQAEQNLLVQQIGAKINCVDTSSMGRLFDVVASLIGIRQEITYEAQAAMELEAAASKFQGKMDTEAYAFELNPSFSSSMEIKYASLLSDLCRDVLEGIDRGRIALQFHHAVARMIRAVGLAARERCGIEIVGLTGGVFQNVLLVQLTERLLRDDGFEVLTHSVVPPNDGGLALGQAAIALRLLGSAC